MLQTILSLKMAMDEEFKIQKNRLTPVHPTGDEKRLCIVTGLHGDELEGQLICYEVVRRLKANLEKLTGIVDIYPAANPLGISAVNRNFPIFEMDMNRIFPGSEHDSLPEYAAKKLLDDIAGADMCVDIHASNIFLNELPQVRVATDTAEDLIEYAKLMNTEFVWIHESKTVFDATLSHCLNVMGVPAFAVEMGVGMRITEQYCRECTDGLFALMKRLGIWQGETVSVRTPIISAPDKVSEIYAGQSGLFVPSVKISAEIAAGDIIGTVVNPAEGEEVETICAERGGRIFTLREYPIVSPGSLIARIISI